MYENPREATAPPLPTPMLWILTIEYFFEKVKSSNLWLNFYYP